MVTMPAECYILWIWLFFRSTRGAAGNASLIGRNVRIIIYLYKVSLHTLSLSSTCEFWGKK